jgi:hypothetical protein
VTAADTVGRSRARTEYTATVDPERLRERRGTPRMPAIDVVTGQQAVERLTPWIAFASGAVPRRLPRDVRRPA